jgi:hypothetical protein
MEKSFESASPHPEASVASNNSHSLESTGLRAQTHATRADLGAIEGGTVLNLRPRAHRGHPTVHTHTCFTDHSSCKTIRLRMMMPGVHDRA